MASERVRPVWAESDDLMRTYYDTEWGVPVTSEHGVFERLCLEGFQAGLSWRTVLVKREAFRELITDFTLVGLTEGRFNLTLRYTGLAPLEEAGLSLF